MTLFWTCSNILHVLPVPMTPKLDAVVQVGSQQRERRGRITFLDQLATLLLIQLAFWAAGAHCWLHLIFDLLNEEHTGTCAPALSADKTNSDLLPKSKSPTSPNPFSTVHMLHKEKGQCFVTALFSSLALDMKGKGRAHFMHDEHQLRPLKCSCSSTFWLI